MMGIVMTLETNMDKIYIHFWNPYGIRNHMAYAVFSTAIATKITIVSVPHFTLVSPISIAMLRFLKKSYEVVMAVDKTGYKA